MSQGMRNKKTLLIRALQNSSSVRFKTVLWFSHLACLQAFTRRCKKHKCDWNLTAMSGLDKLTYHPIVTIWKPRSQMLPRFILTAIIEGVA